MYGLAEIDAAGLLQSLWDALGYGFMQRALLAGCVTAFSCGCLGVFLVLRRFSMIGEGLAHFTFGAIGIGLAVGVWPFYVAAPLAVVASLVIFHLAEHDVFGDAAIGMVSAVGIAAGVLLASLGGGFNVDLFSYLFGDILSVSEAETWGAVVLSALVVLIVLLFHHELFAVTFDAEHARVLGVRVKGMERLLLVLTAVTVVLGIKVVGTLLVSALIIFPAVTALQIAGGFRGVLLLAALQGVLSVVGGIALAFLFDVPAGASIVLLNAVLFVLGWMAGKAFRA